MSTDLSITWLGHSSVVIDIDGVRLLVDPLLRRHAGPLRRRYPQPDPAAWANPDVVLLSHMHADHAELRSLRQVADAPVLTATANARWLRRRGLSGAKGLGRQWVHVGRGDVEVRLTKAVHQHRPMPHRPNAANGHLVRGVSATVWAVGDTSLHDEFAETERLLGRRLDVILVPIAGWGPRLSPGHMDPTQAAEACARSGARWAIPVHWGTLHPPLLDRVGDWMDRPHGEFARALSRLAPDCELVGLQPGQTWSHPGR